MTIALRSYQTDIVSQVLSERRNVLVQADTGSGKTHAIAKIAEELDFVIVVAHRNLLIRQASQKLAEWGILHATICSEHTRRMCILEHRRTVGQEFVDSAAHKHVSSIDRLLSLYRRGLLTLDTTRPWKIIVDEAHHMVDANKWGTLCKVFPNAQIIGFTATPCRHDGQSLARGKGGVFDVLVQAEELRVDSVKKLISWGYLSDFRVFSIPSPFDTATSLVVGKNGEYTDASQLGVFNDGSYDFAGDALKHYRRYADGLQTVVFCVGIQNAEQTAMFFRTHGYSAACISSAMSQVETSRIFDLFRQRVIQILCHVDMIGEGVDVPAIECLILLRKTASIANWRQWCGRTLRVEEGKGKAIIIDHCANVLEHGMPDDHITWDLHRSPRKNKSNLIVCESCRSPYKAWLSSCPECGHESDYRRGAGTQLHGVRYIDVELVEHTRRQIAIAHREATVLSPPKFESTATGAIAEGCRRIAAWFAAVASESYSIAEINGLMTEAWQPKWWIDRFTLADIKKDNRRKVDREMKSWLKSRKSN
jgi:superfamily II DNA or RNA helicase